MGRKVVSHACAGDPRRECRSGLFGMMLLIVDLQ